jgi:hypothetical protein
MKFLNLFHHRSQLNFDSIQGYDDVKNIINRALQSEENFNLLLIGPPASSKTQFLMEIMKIRNCVTIYIYRCYEYHESYTPSSRGRKTKDRLIRRIGQNAETIC